MQKYGTWKIGQKALETAEIAEFATVAVWNPARPSTLEMETLHGTFVS